MAGGLELGKTIEGPQGHQRYLALTGLSGLWTIPLGLARSALVQWRRGILLSLVSAVPIGLAIMLWPFLILWSWL